MNKHISRVTQLQTQQNKQPTTEKQATAAKLSTTHNYIAA
jgi:hypothetical protein